MGGAGQRSERLRSRMRAEMTSLTMAFSSIYGQHRCQPYTSRDWAPISNIRFANSPAVLCAVVLGWRRLKSLTR